MMQKMLDGLFPPVVANDRSYGIAQEQEGSGVEAAPEVQSHGYGVDKYPYPPLFDDLVGQHPGGDDAERGGEGIADRYGRVGVVPQDEGEEGEEKGRSDG